jgi:hypothetical protein
MFKGQTMYVRRPRVMNVKPRTGLHLGRSKLGTIVNKKQTNDRTAMSEVIPVLKPTRVTV